jgi:hypothetical protein
LINDVRKMIDESRHVVSQTVNSALVWLYWNIGQRIRGEILGEERGEYGQQIVSAVGRELSWTQFKHIIYLDDPLKREFYAEMCRTER